VADPEQAFGEASKRYSFVPGLRLSTTITGHHSKVVTVCKPRKWSFFVGRTV